jgi:hypothetical protein
VTTSPSPEMMTWTSIRAVPLELIVMWVDAVDLPITIPQLRRGGSLEWHLEPDAIRRRADRNAPQREAQRHERFLLDIGCAHNRRLKVRRPGLAHWTQPSTSDDTGVAISGAPNVPSMLFV